MKQSAPRLSSRCRSRFRDFIMRLDFLATHNTAVTAALFEELTGLMLEGPDAAYPQTPPELLPIATTGCDGDHYGYFVHAPELGLADYPIGNLCPMDSDGFTLQGKSTPEALERLVSRTWLWQEDA